ncbi:MAG: flagellar biosynthesis anti-sigma factor FlgM [Methylobacter sp.]|jgi:negative regulator of flagellin synthesis FlgM|uniref:flagellar biosynthesis anti-sigma factor FlgM n=1 Tax=Methylobacter TaxID=429 RepID=UPI0003627D95|nr:MULTISPECIES: flagellar biosynthesis anti-sigma factor FlgM [Methylobacter]MCL7419390.1 flagellar biosynthesis anti-sigma factor FlgM [Methylobacter sp.]
MAIESITGRAHPPSSPKTASKTEAGAPKQASAQAPGKVDSIAITAATQEIKKAFASSTSAVDMERVAAVKKALADGSYSIDAEKIAEKLIQFEKLLPPENST